jgi:hypothetical protein
MQNQKIIESVLCFIKTKNFDFECSGGNLKVKGKYLKSVKSEMRKAAKTEWTNVIKNTLEKIKENNSKKSKIEAIFDILDMSGNSEEKEFTLRVEKDRRSNTFKLCDDDGVVAEISLRQQEKPIIRLYVKTGRKIQASKNDVDPRIERFQIIDGAFDYEKIYEVKDSSELENEFYESIIAPINIAINSSKLRFLKRKDTSKKSVMVSIW